MLLSTLDFGKYKGLNPVSIAILDPGYLEWAAVEHDYFYLNDAEVETILTEAQQFEFSEVALVNMSRKQRKQELDCDLEDDGPSWDDYEGTYAQDEAGYDDDSIDYGFDDDPDMYWNID